MIHEQNEKFTTDIESLKGSKQKFQNRIFQLIKFKKCNREYKYQNKWAENRINELEDRNFEIIPSKQN